jgi:putative DNA primase/helicase
MRELTFGAAEGHSTTYSQRAPGCDTGQDEYRSILVANGEETSDELAMLAGEFRIPGECSKWMDVPAIEGDSPDIFDLGPELDTEERTAWFKKRCADVRAGCLVHHGRAIQNFIREVIARRKTIRAELVTLRDQFVKAVAKAGTDHVALHMANNFGHLYAAGVLAVQFGTVPWSERLVFKCVRRCYRAARREIKTEAELLRRALLRLKARAEKKTILLDKHYKCQSLKNVDGYRRIERKKIVLTVRAEAFKRWFEDRQPATVAAAKAGFSTATV